MAKTAIVPCNYCYKVFEGKLQENGHYERYHFRCKMIVKIIGRKRWYFPHPGNNRRRWWRRTWRS